MYCVLEVGVQPLRQPPILLTAILSQSCFYQITTNRYRTNIRLYFHPQIALSKFSKLVVTKDVLILSACSNILLTQFFPAVQQTVAFSLTPHVYSLSNKSILKTPKVCLNLPQIAKRSGLFNSVY